MTIVIRGKLSVALILQVRETDVLIAGDGLTGLSLVERESPDLVLLAVTRPGTIGFEVLRRLRPTSDIPIILLTARSEELDKVGGLELGADDYVIKPFGHQELVARNWSPGSGLPSAPRSCPRRCDVLGDGGRRGIQFESREVTKGGRPVSLTPIGPSPGRTCRARSRRG